MQWFKKLFPKRDASPVRASSPSRFRMKWFKRSTVATDREPQLSPLRSEVDVVPKTEINTAARQALNNISIALGETPVDESSGSSKPLEENDAADNKRIRIGCENKYCCGVNKSQRAHQGVDKSIQNFRSSKSSIENLRQADNSVKVADGSIISETERRQLAHAGNNVKNADCITFFDPFFDYGKLERPDSAQTSQVDTSTEGHGQYVHLKSKSERNYSHNFDLFSINNKLESAVDKSHLNCELLSNVEKQLDESKYNLLNCKIFNNEYRKAQSELGSGCIEGWKLEDFNDDLMSTPMSEDTSAIKEFYRLSTDCHVLLHYQDIVEETGCAAESLSNDLTDLIAWIVLKGKEITEERKISKTFSIKTILNFFRKSSK